jgi:hypothetical protein
MTKEFVYIKKFLEKWEKLGLTDDDLIPLEKIIMENPSAGDVIRGTGGLRKLRWGLPGTGKRGGIRVAFINIVLQEKVYILDLFLKNEKDNYTNAEKAILKQLVSRLIKEGE